LVSTKLPMCASASITLSGLRCANGPSSARSPTLLCVITQYGLIFVPSPISASTSTEADVDARAGADLRASAQAHARPDFGVGRNLDAAVDARVAVIVTPALRCCSRCRA